jgi:hypothetical protein
MSELRPFPRRPGFALLGLFVAFAAGGCSYTETVWEAAGEYEAEVTGTGPGGTVRGTVYRTGGIQTDERVRMCAVRNVTWGLPFPEAVRDQVAAVVSALSGGLCEEDTVLVTEGAVLTYQPVGGDTLTLRAEPEPGWTVTGQVVVTEYTNHHPEDPDVNERVLSETSVGTFELEAHGPGGAVLLFEEGTFRFDIHVRKDRINPFS